MKNYIKGFINIIILVFTGLILLGTGLLFIKQPEIKLNQPLLELGVQTLTIRQGGTGEDSFASSTLVMANGTDKLTGTSTPTADSFHATSTTISSEISGTLLVNTLTITGTCSGCGTGIDFQDIYNNSASDAQITTADAKDILLFLSNTTTDPNVIISSEGDGQGQLQLAVASTTLGVWQTYGRLGIATTSPGTGLSVQATTTLLGLDTYIYGQLTLPYIVATSTQNNSFAGALDVTEAATSTYTGGITTATGGLAVTTGGLRVDAGEFTVDEIFAVAGLGTSTITDTLDINGLTDLASLFISGTGTTTSAGGFNLTNLRVSSGIDITGGDSLFTNTIKVAGAATSTFSSATGGLTVLGTLVPSTFYSLSTATSSFEGGLQAKAGGLKVFSGLDVASGDALFSGAIKVAGTATSTIAGGLSVTGAINTPDIFISTNIGTSTWDGAIKTDRNIISSFSIIGGFASTTAGTTVIDCAQGNYHEIQLDRDLTIGMKNCVAGQTLTLGLQVHAPGDFQVSWQGVTASSSLYWREATSTVGYLEQGKMNFCSFRFATSSNFAFADCAGGFSPK